MSKGIASVGSKSCSLVHKSHLLRDACAFRTSNFLRNEPSLWAVVFTSYVISSILFFPRSQAEADPSPPFPLRRVQSDESVSVRGGGGGDQSRGRRRDRTGRTTWYDEEEEEEEEGEEEEEAVVRKEEKEDSREDLVSLHMHIKCMKN